MRDWRDDIPDTTGAHNVDAEGSAKQLAPGNVLGLRAGFGMAMASVLLGSSGGAGGGG